ncbi:unnamed protein product [Schistocephalus solidus]|uniref:FH2 domain-containing protein n=1 Tax=Schistocephalus solidus TaxID=70667 RepID=A0A183TCZ0_SCHSO|nr:unnamed protein product [Schistocephalus solidus]
MDAKALSTRVLEQLVAGVRDPQIRKALLRDQPSTLEKTLALAGEEEILQAACEQPPRSIFGVTAIQPHSLEFLEFIYLAFIFEGLEVHPEGGYALPEVFNEKKFVEKLVAVPPEGGSATDLKDATGDSRLFL